MQTFLSFYTRPALALVVAPAARADNPFRIRPQGSTCRRVLSRIADASDGELCAGLERCIASTR